MEGELIRPGMGCWIRSQLCALLFSKLLLRARWVEVALDFSFVLQGIGFCKLKNKDPFACVSTSAQERKCE